VNHKSGFVAVLGVPNVGKSTLVNILTGHKVSGVSSKPQTTRRRILGVRTEPGCQIIFVDTPGYCESRNRLGELMGRTVMSAARESDIILYVVDAVKPESEEGLTKLLGRTKVPVLLVVNKIDLVPKPELLPLLERLNGLLTFKELVPISALHADGTSLLLDLIRQQLPEGPTWYDGGSAAPVADPALVQEVIQEKLFAQLHQEVPYGCAVLVEQVEREESLLRVEAMIVTERESHKPILIGGGGSRLKTIGTQARLELERLLGVKVFLKLWVKVEEDWRNREAVLADLGYVSPARH